MSDPYDDYWRVGGSTTQVYSTRVDNYVPVSDANYVAWLALGNMVHDVSSEQEVGVAVSTTFQTPDPAASVVRSAYFDQLNRPTYTNARWIKANAASTSTSTGALIVDGGVGIAGNLNVGGTITGALALGSITGLGAGVATFLATPSSANLAAAVTGETGTGALVFATSPALVTPDLGTPTAINLTNGTALPATSITGAGALTAANDTNVTLTLGGTPATALLRAASITAGWTGTLAAARLNANVVQAVTNDTNVTGSIASQTLTLGWTGTLAVSRGGTGAGTLTGLLQGTGTTAVSAIANSSTTGQVLRVTGVSTYAWGALDVSSANAVVNRLAYANLAQGSARSVLGVTGNVTADVASIQGTADQVLVVNTAGTALAFGTVATGGITNSAVTYAKIQNITTARLLGRTTAASGVIEEISAGATLTLSALALGVNLAGTFAWTGQHTFTQNIQILKGNALVQADDGTATTNIYLQSKGAGEIGFLNGAANTCFSVIPSGASGQVNFVRAYSNSTGNQPALGAVGTDTNVSLVLSGQGTGVIYSGSVVQIASATASTSPSTGALQVLAGGVGVSGAINAGTYIAAPAATGFWVAGKATGVNFNSANTDTSIPITLPSGFTRYRVTLCFISHASISLTTATCGLFTAAGGTGTTVVTLATTGITSTAENTNNNGVAMAVVGAATMTLNAATLFFRIGTAQGAAATADVTIYVTPLP